MNNKRLTEQKIVYEQTGLYLFSVVMENFKFKLKI